MGKQKVLVRFRKDGVLSTYYKFPTKYRSVFVSRIKVMAHLDISNKNKPQDGKINFRHFAPIDIELRVATIPTAGGIEDVVIRILSGGKCMPINAIGLSTPNLDNLMAGVTRPYGMFLVCGPTGSGKSTTLHSILNYLNSSERKIWTAEDPVEITQPGLRQLEVNEKVGMTFSGAMRAFLRADPDIIMIGEMRDTETAGTAIEASLTGHLVLSTLHTNSAAESIVRLLDMDMDPFNFADAMIGILSQRLTKTLCTSCKKPYVPEAAELEFLATEYCREAIPDGTRSDPDEGELEAQLKIWETEFTQKGEFTLYKAPGCMDCLDSGYRGRMGIHELLMSTPAIKKMILRRAPAAEIHYEGVSSGMRTRKQDGIEKILMGYTDYTQIRTL
jgi:type II secretory ATPase GspE/PulE/Tfp pilus assembly ATPase PilB-like protein